MMRRESLYILRGVNLFAGEKDFRLDALTGDREFGIKGGEELQNNLLFKNL